MTEGVLALVSALSGVVVERLMSALGQFWRDRRESTRRRHAELLDLYAIWIPEMQQRLEHHTSETWSSTVDLSVVNLKLDVLDPKGLQLRWSVLRTLPDEVEDSERYASMKEAQYTQTWYDPFRWPEFETAMTAVIEHVRRLNPDRGS